MNDLFDFIKCYMPKSESVMAFEMLFDNFTTGIFLEVFLKFQHFSSL